MSLFERMRLRRYVTSDWPGTGEAPPTMPVSEAAEFGAKMLTERDHLRDEVDHWFRRCRKLERELGALRERPAGTTAAYWHGEARRWRQRAAQHERSAEEHAERCAVLQKANEDLTTELGRLQGRDMSPDHRLAPGGRR